MRWLSEWIKRQYVEPGIAKCYEPKSMEHQLVLSTPLDSFV